MENDKLHYSFPWNFSVTSRFKSQNRSKQGDVINIVIFYKPQQQKPWIVKGLFYYPCRNMQTTTAAKTSQNKGIIIFHTLHLPYSTSSTHYIFHTHSPYAPINVKPEGGGGGAGNPREFVCHVCPQGGDFDHLIFQLRREEEKKTILLTIILCPGVGILIFFFFENAKIPTLFPIPPPLSGLTSIGALHSQRTPPHSARRPPPSAFRVSPNHSRGRTTREGHTD